jgi:hypothetical protein
MSNYRSFYGRPLWADFEDLTPKQRRRGARKSERDFLAGGQPPSHPRRGMGTSGNPARRAEGHYQTSGWGGVPGECGAECVCGVTFDGFDSIAEASALLDGHMAASPRPRTREPLRGDFARYVAVRHSRPAPPADARRPGQPAWAKRFDLVERAR